MFLLGMGCGGLLGGVVRRIIVLYFVGCGLRRFTRGWHPSIGSMTGGFVGLLVGCALSRAESGLFCCDQDAECEVM